MDYGDKVRYFFLWGVFMYGNNLGEREGDWVKVVIWRSGWNMNIYLKFIIYRNILGERCEGKREVKVDFEVLSLNRWGDEFFNFFNCKLMIMILFFLNGL